MKSIQSVASRAAEALGRESWLIRRLRPAYEAVLDGLSDQGALPWVINDVECRIDPHYRRHFAPSYEPSVAAFLRERVRAGDICLDVGANAGVYVLQLAHWSRPDGRIMAFEPNPSAREVLQRHVSLNRLESRVEILPQAVGAAPGQALLYAAGTDGMSRLKSPHPALAREVRPIRVPVTTLDDYCASTGLEPDWLLMDIEGYEIAALAGARQLLKRRGRQLGIVVELHPDSWSAAGTGRDEAAATITALGRRVVPLSGQTAPLHEHGLVYLPSDEIGGAVGDL